MNELLGEHIGPQIYVSKGITPAIEGCYPIQGLYCPNMQCDLYFLWNLSYSQMFEGGKRQ